MVKIYGLTGKWLLVAEKELEHYLADGYLLEPPKLKSDPVVKKSDDAADPVVEDSDGEEVKRVKVTRSRRKPVRKE